MRGRSSSHFVRSSRAGARRDEVIGERGREQPTCPCPVRGHVARRVGDLLGLRLPPVPLPSLRGLGVRMNDVAAPPVGWGRSNAPHHAGVSGPGFADRCQVSGPGRLEAAPGRAMPGYSDVVGGCVIGKSSTIVHRASGGRRPALGRCSAAVSGALEAPAYPPSRAGRALAQALIEPAPRQTTISPGRAWSFTKGARSASPSSAWALRWP